jgi:hypothetical protein
VQDIADLRAWRVREPHFDGAVCVYLGNHRHGRELTQKSARVRAQTERSRIRLTGYCVRNKARGISASLRPFAFPNDTIYKLPVVRLNIRYVRIESADVKPRAESQRDLQRDLAVDLALVAMGQRTGDTVAEPHSVCLARVWGF